MPRSIQRIGILTGGGDCPGLNAVIRAVAKTAIFSHSLEVIGILDGFAGLVENRMRPLTHLDVSGILTRGGTILGTNNRANPSRYFCGNDDRGEPQFRSRIDDCIANARAHRLDAIIVIGGDGTMSCAAPLVDAGLNCIGVPKTIDNDIDGTEITFGFLTAVDTATEALDKLHSTAASHHRVMICELMGRNAGWIALHAGVASGSDVILIPEIEFDLDLICQFIKSRDDRNSGGKGFSIIACAEGARPRGGQQVVARRDPRSHDPIRLGGVGEFIAAEIADRTGIETRTTVLGHVQRGGTPTSADRILATQFGFHAMQVLMQGGQGRMVVRQGGRFADVELRAAAHRQRLVPLDHPLIAAARAVRTCFGDEPSV